MGIRRFEGDLIALVSTEKPCTKILFLFQFLFLFQLLFQFFSLQFQTFLTTAECLYSLVNGDDMYPTFSSMPSRNISIWIFSKLYIYIFVSLFIYLILSTFISIVGDAYERLKVCVSDIHNVQLTSFRHP